MQNSGWRPGARLSVPLEFSDHVKPLTTSGEVKDHLQDLQPSKAVVFNLPNVLTPQLENYFCKSGEQISTDCVVPRICRRYYTLHFSTSCGLPCIVLILEKMQWTPLQLPHTWLLRERSY